jgi:hypothetical protein
VIVILGATAFARMPVDVFPDIKIPAVVVATFYQGMPPLDAHVSEAIRVALSVVGIAMLLSFPINRSHQFEVRLRTPEVRRAIQRNTFVAQPEITGGERVVQANYADAKPPPSAADALVAPVLRIDEFKAKFWSQEPITQQDFYVQEKEESESSSQDLSRRASIEC